VKTLKRDNSGQALLEVSLLLPLLAVLVLGIVDFSRAIYDAEVIKTSLARAPAWRRAGPPWPTRPVR